MMLYLVVVILGMLVPIQTAANVRLRMRVQSVWVATLLSFSVSTLALLDGSAAPPHHLLAVPRTPAHAAWGGYDTAMNSVAPHK